jgi:hypothetical protein
VDRHWSITELLLRAVDVVEGKGLSVFLGETRSLRLLSIEISIVRTSGEQLPGSKKLNAALT